MRNILIGILCFTLISASLIETGSLKAHIVGIEEVSGKLAIQVLNARGEAVGEYWLFVESSEVILEVPDLPNGDYAVKFFHDANNNGTMDKNWLGIPTEAFGFSNDAKVVFGPPNLREMLFLVNGDTEITIRAKRL